MRFLAEALWPVEIFNAALEYCLADMPCRTAECLTERHQCQQVPWRSLTIRGPFMAAEPVRLGREFYSRLAIDSVKDFLGKALVHRTNAGTVSGIVYDVEAYPAFVDGVHHGNKRTRRAEVMWGPPGYAYVYLIYGKWFQFAAVVAREGVPDVVFIRAAKPQEGLALMTRQWDKEMRPETLCGSPGKLCTSMCITKESYGLDLCGSTLYFEDWGIEVPHDRVRVGKRVGISTDREGHQTELRFYLGTKDVQKLGNTNVIS